MNGNGKGEQVFKANIDDLLTGKIVNKARESTEDPARAASGQEHGHAPANGMVRVFLFVLAVVVLAACATFLLFRRHQPE